MFVVYQEETILVVANHLQDCPISLVEVEQHCSHLAGLDRSQDNLHNWQVVEVLQRRQLVVVAHSGLAAVERLGLALAVGNMRHSTYSCMPVSVRTRINSRMT